MNRSLWAETLTEYYCPPFPCPTCKKGFFSLIPKSLVNWETVKSKNAHRNDEYWSFHDTDFRFSARLKCGHSSCGDEAVIMGVGGVEEQISQDGWEPSDYFSPKFCLPMPDIITIPEKCPSPISDELRASFALFWADRAAAANRIRAALEHIMNHFRIPRNRKNAKGGLSRLSLNERLTLFQKFDTTLSERLMAIKWFGNTGSHGRDITRDELLDVFEVLEDTLVELFEQRKRRLNTLTRSLMKKHAPQRKRKTAAPRQKASRIA